MNSRQRRGVILLVLSALCAMGAFAGVLSVIRDVNSKVGPEVAAYRLKGDIAPYKELSADQFEKVEMPERWLSSTAVTDLSQNGSDPDPNHNGDPGDNNDPTRFTLIFAIGCGSGDE